MFSEHPCANMQNMQKRNTNTSFHITTCKTEQFYFVLLVFFQFLGIANPLQHPAGARTIHSAISYLS